jgi:SWI/SNF-related matrix-associated actin-dependent regulator of chromatin subfamily D
MVGAHPQNSLTPSQMQAQQQAHAQATARAKLRSQKPTDKNIPEGVEDCIIGDGVQRYRDLRDIERRLDSTMMRKRLDLQDSVNRNVKVGYRNLFVTCRADCWLAVQNVAHMGEQYSRGPAMASRYP